MNDEYPKWIENTSRKLYSFVFCLIPDELQSRQLVIDSISKVFIEHRGTVKDKSRIKLLIYKTAFLLAKKRAYQLDGLLIDNEEIEVSWKRFYERLPIERRAVMYLDMKLRMSVEEIMEVTELPRFEVIEKIYGSRDLLIQQEL